jgi:molybdopterin-guanine dinucleotide biosynthesis protein A
MGSDKALLERDGETQLERAMRLLGEQLERVFVSARPSQSEDPLRNRYPQIIDRYEDLGPVAGILSAMDEDPDASWLVLACDLPNIDAETLRYLLEHVSSEHQATAYISVNDGLPEPLCAVYRPAFREIIDRFVQDGVICPRKMLINSPTCLLEQPNPGALHNINTPDDLDGTGIKLAMR